MKVICGKGKDFPSIKATVVFQVFESCITNELVSFLKPNVPVARLEKAAAGTPVLYWRSNEPLVCCSSCCL